MANPEHVDIVKQGAEAIEAWRESNPYSRLDLSGADFQFNDLSKADLSGTNLSEADLWATNLSRADLSNAGLYEANLREANLSEANLIKANLIKANLSGANLCEANLCEANLSKADLSRADLREANLCEANLCEANLSKANLSKADLREANLCEANLIKANLSKADLCRTDLREANLNSTSLRGANLKEAIVSGTVWIDLDLSQPEELDSIKHFGRSSLGVDTLIKSKGQIPEVFLRGCGLSDDFISYIPSHFANSAINFYSCFISYSHEDKSFARRLHDALQGRGIRCWLDEKKMLPGDDFGEHIDRGIKVWDKVLLCASEHSLTSYWVNKELEHTFAKEEQLFKREKKAVRSLIPLNLDNYLFTTWEHKERNSICNRLAADFIDWEIDNAKFEEQFERVVKALQTNDTGRDPDPIPKL